MLRMFRKSIGSPAMIVALIALFVALGGTAVALNGSNTVFSDDIVNNEVYSADVRNDTLAAGGLAASDLRPGSVGPSEANGLTGADIADVPNGSDNVNADRLIGLQPDAFILGGDGRGPMKGGIAAHYAEEIAANQQANFLFAGYGFNLEYNCPSDPLNNNGYFRFTSYRSGIELFIDNGGTDPQYVRMGDNTAINIPTNRAGELITLQFYADEFGPALTTASLTSVHVPGNPGLTFARCQAQVQAVQTHGSL